MRRHFLALALVLLSVGALAISDRQQQTVSSKSDLAAFESLFQKANVANLLSSASVMKEGATAAPTTAPILANVDLTAVAVTPAPTQAAAAKSAAPAPKASATVAANPTLTNLDMTAVQTAPASSSSSSSPSVNRANEMYLVANADGTLVLSHLAFGLLLAGCVLVTAVVTLVATIMSNGCKCGKKDAAAAHGAPHSARGRSSAADDSHRTAYAPVQDDNTYIY